MQKKIAVGIDDHENNFIATNYTAGKWDFEPTKDTPYLALTGELWGVFNVGFG